MDELQRLRERGASDQDRLELLHEISVYQEELLAQNDALIRARTALEDTRDRFIELYDFALNGYLILDRHGVIHDCNLTAAALLGHSKPALEGVPLLGFVDADDRSLYFDFLRRFRGHDRADIEIELNLRTGNGRRCVQVLCRPEHPPKSGAHREYLTSIIDITDRKALERERDTMSREHAALAGRLISVQDAERTRIARNLHDDIGQEMTALRIMLELLADQASSPAFAEGVTRAQQTLRTLDQRLHFVASELRPAALDLGIVAALEQFAQQWAATFGIAVTFRSSGEMDALTGEDATHLYRIVQEALNNISKHAGASKVAITIQRQDDVIELRVHDDGRGFDPAAVRRSSTGLGLVGMRERAQLMGGSLEVQSTGGGTVLTVRIGGAFRRAEESSPSETAGERGGGAINAAREGTRPPRRAPRS